MRELIVKNLPKSPTSEAYRALRTNLQFANLDGGIKTILLTSATAGEGKTSTLCNLAMTLVDTGKRVLIVDCDMRKPRVHKFFEITNKHGVADLLVKHLPVQDCIQNVVHPKLDVLTAGNIPSNPSELLQSQAMRTLVEELKGQYDYVFFDTPPVMPVTDAVVMSNYIDAVILVCASGRVQIEHAKRAKENLINVGAKVLGVVLNRVPIKGNNYYYYYYYAEKEGEK